jgi:hypothetical protein
MCAAFWNTSADSSSLSGRSSVRQLGKDRLKRLYKDADALHCEPIEKIADEVVSVYGVKGGTFDNVSRCLYEVPDYWTIGEVYERLVEDICAENEDVDFIVGVVLQVYTSWINKAISNYNTDFFLPVPGLHLRVLERRGGCQPVTGGLLFL